MFFRFPLSPPASLLDLFGRIRDLLPQLEPKILKDVSVNTETTSIAHGLKRPPRIVRAPLPHCLAFVCEAQPPDATNIYLRASNICVCDVELFP